MKKAIWIILILTLASSAYSQKIIRVAKDLVLIDTDQGIGRVGDERAVYRLVDSKVREIGTLQLLRFQNGRAAARIIHLDRKFNIKIGDLLTPPVQTLWTPPPEPHDPVLQGRQYIIEKVVSGFALVSGAQGIGRVGEELHVSRIIKGKTVPVGTLKIIKFSSGKTATQIIQESSKYSIQPGDFILKLEKKQPDLDTYFYDTFQPQ